eukprot:6832860-Prymnesium_polylepis.1
MAKWLHLESSEMEPCAARVPQTTWRLKSRFETMTIRGLRFPSRCTGRAKFTQTTCFQPGPVYVWHWRRASWTPVSGCL